jgi:DNA-binding NarL/FixJ family response regulator
MLRTVAPSDQTPARLPAAKILVADDHPLVCAALTHTLRAAMPDGVVLTVSTLGALEETLAHHADLDLALLDLNMPGARGISALLLLRGLRPDLPIVVISANDRPRTVALAQRFGAAGFLSKSAPLPLLLTAIDAVLGGAAWFPSGGDEASREDALFATRLAQLTPQQMRVLLGIADGLLNKQIAHELGLAENTVKVHVAAVLHKLGCHTRTHAAVLVRAMDGDFSPVEVGDRTSASA